LNALLIPADDFPPLGDLWAIIGSRRSTVKFGATAALACQLFPKLQATIESLWATKTMDFYNTALIQDEILINIATVLEEDWTAGPSFLYALGSLIEAAVIHDKVYFDPMRSSTLERQQDDTIHAFLKESSFVQKLISEDVLVLFPPDSQVNKYLKAHGREYEFINFMMDYYYEQASFVRHYPEGDATEFKYFTWIMKNAPSLFAQDTLIEREVPGVALVLTTEGLKAQLLGLDRQAMIELEALNRKARAYLELTKNLGINLYPVLLALPFQINAIKVSNSQAKSIYKQIVNEAISLEDDLEDEDYFSRVPIPPLAQIALVRCKGSVVALADEIIELRYRHRKFRQYLTDYEREWETAKTRKERRKLKNDFTNAWNGSILNFV
jgi:hypothetical protein